MPLYRNNIILISAVALSFVTIFIIHLLSSNNNINVSDQPNTDIAIHDTIKTSKTNRSESKPIKTAEDSDHVENEDLLLVEIEAEFILSSRERYSNIIEQKFIQVQFIEKLLRFLQEVYPDTWRDEVERILGNAFPDFSSELFDTFQKLEKYQSLISHKREAFTNLTADDRRRQIWEIRESLFGDQAYEIWEASYKNEQLTNSLLEISQQQNLPINQRFENYVDTIHSIYDTQAEQLLASKQQEVMDRFLTVSTNQKTLESLSVNERHQQLRSMRQQLGMNDAALQRWDTLDNKRHQRWELGQTYMRERESIDSQYSGRERDEKINALRDSMFGEQAKSLAVEEASGYYRFNGKQIYGIN